MVTLPWYPTSSDQFHLHIDNSALNLRPFPFNSVMLTCFLCTDGFFTARCGGIAWRQQWMGRKPSRQAFETTTCGECDDWSSWEWRESQTQSWSCGSVQWSPQRGIFAREASRQAEKGSPVYIWILKSSNASLLQFALYGCIAKVSTIVQCVFLLTINCNQNLHIR